MNRTPPPLRPDWCTGRLATALLGIVVAGLVGVFAWSGWGTPVQPVAMVRLLFTLPPLVMFGSVLAVRAFTPPLLALMLGVAMAGLTLWSAFGAGLELYVPAEPDDWSEVLFMGVTVVGLVGYLWASQQEGRRVAVRAHEAATRDPLTELLNRAGLECFYSGLEPGTPLTLAMLDLNGLKQGRARQRERAPETGRDRLLARRDLGFDVALYFREEPEGFLLVVQVRPRARAGLSAGLDRRLPESPAGTPGVAGGRAQKLSDSAGFRRR